MNVAQRSKAMCLTILSWGLNVQGKATHFLVRCWLLGCTPPRQQFYAPGPEEENQQDIEQATAVNRCNASEELCALRHYLLPIRVFSRRAGGVGATRGLWKECIINMGRQVATWGDQTTEQAESSVKKVKFSRETTNEKIGACS